MNSFWHLQRVISVQLEKSEYETFTEDYGIYIAIRVFNIYLVHIIHREYKCKTEH